MKRRVLGYPLRIAMLAGLVSLLLGSAGGPGGAVPAHADAIAHVVPGQFIAKIYTEALGRMPTQAEWQSWTDAFTNSLDCEQTAKDAVYQLYTSPDFLLRYPDEGPGKQREAQLLALSRGALNEEIVQNWYSYYMAEPWFSQPFSVTIGDLLLNTRADLFNAIVHNACDVGDPPWYEDAPYYWRNTPVADIGWVGPPADPWVYHGHSGSELQQLLYAAQGQTSTVFLAQRVVVYITTTLVIPAGITLTTWHDATSPPLAPDRYALMGRLVRTFSESTSLVDLQTCSTLQGVWIDGQKAQLGSRRPDQAGAVNVGVWDISALPQCQTRLVGNRLADPFGGTQVKAWGKFETGQSCGDVYIGQNLLTGYANSHYFANQWADGLSIACEHTLIEGNQIVDATDVGIVVFRDGEEQHTIVRDNALLNAGNSAFGGMVADPYVVCPPATPGEYDFTGTVFQENVLWTSPQSHLDTILVAGTYAWQFNLCPGGTWPQHNWGRGAAFLDNKTGNRGVCPNCTVRTNSPIIVSGMFDTLVQCNDLRVEIVNLIECHYPGKSAPGESIVLASVTQGWASFQEPAPPYTNATLMGCVSHVVDSVPPVYPPVPVWPCPVSWSYLPLIYKSTPQSFTEGVTNGGFEAGLAPAVASSADQPWPVVCDWANPGNACRPGGGAYHVARRGAHSGDWAAWLGGYDRADDVLTQTVTIPPDLTAATLSFWRYIATAERTGAGDHLRVELRDSAGRLIAEFGRLDSQDRHRETWWPERWDVSAYLEPYRGQQIWLRFEATTDGNNRATSFFVDDVSLTLAAPADLPLPPPEGGYPPPPERLLPPPATPQGGYPPPATPGPTPSPTPMPQLPVKPTRSPGP